MTELPTSRPGSSALRRGRRSLAGAVYLVTFVTFRRRRYFAEIPAACRAAAEIASAGAWGDARLLAWVLMPDHFHGLLQLGDIMPLHRAVGRARGNVSRAWHAADCRPLWMPGFQDRAVRRTEDLRAAARYLVANPLRAGLVDDVGAYPFWDAVWLQESPL